MSFEIQHLFAIPILNCKELYEFKDEEINFILNMEKKKNIGNDTTTNRYILNNEILKDIRDFIQDGIKSYVDNIICPKNKKLEFYITESWANFTKTGAYHHMHSHQNSLISGCLYINAVKNKDKITFFNQKYKRIYIPSDNFNIYNSTNWWIPIESGKLILFDSSIEHMVETTETPETRISIAFNVFIKGVLGDEDGLKI
jgi:uncharacterized protein (TIGR02466 family)